MPHDWSCDSEYNRTSLEKYELPQFYSHIQTFDFPLKGRTKHFCAKKHKAIPN